MPLWYHPPAVPVNLGAPVYPGPLLYHPAPILVDSRPQHACDTLYCTCSFSVGPAPSLRATSSSALPPTAARGVAASPMVVAEPYHALKKHVTGAVPPRIRREVETEWEYDIQPPIAHRACSHGSTVDVAIKRCDAQDAKRVSVRLSGGNLHAHLANYGEEAASGTNTFTLREGTIERIKEEIRRDLERGRGVGGPQVPAQQARYFTPPTATQSCTHTLAQPVQPELSRNQTLAPKVQTKQEHVLQTPIKHNHTLQPLLTPNPIPPPPVNLTVEPPPIDRALTPTPPIQSKPRHNADDISKLREEIRRELAIEYGEKMKSLATREQIRDEVAASMASEYEEKMKSLAAREEDIQKRTEAIKMREAQWIREYGDGIVRGEPATDIPRRHPQPAQSAEAKGGSKHPLGDRSKSNLTPNSSQNPAISTVSESLKPVPGRPHPSSTRPMRWLFPEHELKSYRASPSTSDEESFVSVGSTKRRIKKLLEDQPSIGNDTSETASESNNGGIFLRDCGREVKFTGEEQGVEDQRRIHSSRAHYNPAVPGSTSFDDRDAIVEEMVMSIPKVLSTVGATSDNEAKVEEQRRVENLKADYGSDSKIFDTSAAILEEMRNPIFQLAEYCSEPFIPGAHIVEEQILIENLKADYGPAHELYNASQSKVDDKRKSIPKIDGVNNKGSDYGSIFFNPGPSDRPRNSNNEAGNDVITVADGPTYEISSQVAGNGKGTSPGAPTPRKIPSPNASQEYTYTRQSHHSPHAPTSDPTSPLLQASPSQSLSIPSHASSEHFIAPPYTARAYPNGRIPLSEKPCIPIFHPDTPENERIVKATEIPCREEIPNPYEDSDETVSVDRDFSFCEPYYDWATHGLPPMPSVMLNARGELALSGADITTLPGEIWVAERSPMALNLFTELGYGYYMSDAREPESATHSKIAGELKWPPSPTVMTISTASSVNGDQVKVQSQETKPKDPEMEEDLLLSDKVLTTPAPTAEKKSIVDDSHILDSPVIFDSINRELDSPPLTPNDPLASFGSQSSPSNTPYPEVSETEAIFTLPPSETGHELEITISRSASSSSSSSSSSTTGSYRTSQNESDEQIASALREHLKHVATEQGGKRVKSVHWGKCTEAQRRFAVSEGAGYYLLSEEEGDEDYEDSGSEEEEEYEVEEGMESMDEDEDARSQCGSQASTAGVVDSA